MMRYLFKMGYNIHSQFVLYFLPVDHDAGLTMRDHVASKAQSIKRYQTEGDTEGRMVVSIDPGSLDCI